MDSILIDESIFDEAFIPERLVSREGQIKEIARCLAPAKVGKSIRNLLVVGQPGVGKTIVCRWILKEHFPKHSVFLSAWSKRTSHKVIEEILLQLGLVVHGKESTSELVKKIEKSGRKILVCIDEADHLKDSDILYVLARNNCGIILISNEAFLSNTDSRITDRLFLNEIEFKPYSKDEIFDILKERVSCGLRPNTVSDSLLSIISGMCNGDARIGLQTLRVAAKDAESKGLEKITIEEIKAAAKCARKYRMSYLLGKLNEHQRVIYEILKKKVRIASGKLYEEYSKVASEPVVDRAYRNYMKTMVELGLIKVEGSGRWKIYEISI